MTLLPVSCARADTYVQESGDARVLSHRPTPSHADLVGPSPVRLDGVEPTTLCGNLNISLIWPSNARYSEPVLNISRNGFIIITRIQNRHAQRLDIDQTMRYPHTPRGDTHHRHIRTPGSRTQLNTTKSPRRPPRPSSRQPAPRRAPRTTRSTPHATGTGVGYQPTGAATTTPRQHKKATPSYTDPRDIIRPPVHTSISAQQPPQMASTQGVAHAVPERHRLQQQIIIMDCATVCSRNPASVATSTSNAALGRCRTSCGSGGSSAPRSGRRPSGCYAS